MEFCLVVNVHLNARYIYIFTCREARVAWYRNTDFMSESRYHENWNGRQTTYCIEMQQFLWQVDCRISVRNQHARASCFLQEQLISSKSSKTVRYQIVEASKWTGQTCSCLFLAVLEFILFLCGIHCRSSFFFFFSFLCALLSACLASLPLAEVSRGVAAGGWGWAGCPRGFTLPGHPSPCWLCSWWLRVTLRRVAVCYPERSPRSAPWVFSSRD